MAEQKADRIKQEIIDEVERAVKFARESPFPDPEEALEGVYA